MLQVHTKNYNLLRAVTTIHCFALSEPHEVVFVPFEENTQKCSAEVFVQHQQIVFVVNISSCMGTRIAEALKAYWTRTRWPTAVIAAHKLAANHHVENGPLLTRFLCMVAAIQANNRQDRVLPAGLIASLHSLSPCTGPTRWFNFCTHVFIHLVLQHVSCNTT